MRSALGQNSELKIGPPGTGKTYHLLNIIDEYLSEGGDPRKVAFVSFTRKAVKEASDRAKAKFNLSDKDFDLYRTLHSFAFRMLSLSKSMVLSKEHYKEIGEIIGVKITGRGGNGDTELNDLPPGEQLVFIESLSRLRQLSAKEVWQESDADVDFALLEAYIQTLKAYKSAHLLMDFTDMLEKYLIEGDVPPISLLVVDEAQDLSPLQWRMVEKLSQSAKRTCIAGDDDQAIFRWSGADVGYFLALSKEIPTTVLHQSYRLPKAVYQAASVLVRQIRSRSEKSFLPTDIEGFVDYEDDLSCVDMSQGTWLILHRHQYPLKGIEEEIRGMGLPYRTQYYSTHKDKGIQAAIAWEHYRKGGELDTELLSEFLPKGSENLTAYPWYDILTLSDAQIDYFRGLRRRGESIVRDPRIRISTIHGAKGGEADHVVLFSDITGKVQESLDNDPDDETRVFYVGMTRAKKSLTIIQPQTRNYFNL